MKRKRKQTSSLAVSAPGNAQEPLAQSQRLRRRFCLWLMLAGLLMERSDRNRLEVSLSVRLELRVVQHFE